MASGNITTRTNLATPQPTMLMYAALSPFGVTDDRKITANALLQEITANVTDVSLGFGNGVAATVSAASKGKIIYNATAQAFQVSENGGTYVSLLNSGSGVVGPATATDNAIARFDGTTGKLIQNSAVLVADTSGNFTVPNNWTVANAAAVSVQLTATQVIFAGGVLVAGTGPTTLTDAAGKILSAALNTVGVAQGGTGVTTFTANGVLYGNAATSVLVTAQGAANSILTANAGAPSFSQAPIVNTSVQIGVASSVTGSLILANASTANLTTLRAGNAASALVFVLPVVDPTVGQVLSASAPSGGIVTLSWIAAGGGGSPGAPVNSVQFNSASAFAGNAGLLYIPGSTTGNELALASATITSGNLFSIAASGTVAASNTKTGLNVITSGANATATQTTYGVQVSNTSTGATSTNIALSLSASGGTTNYALSISSGQVVAPDGSSGTPSYSFSGGPNYGIRRGATQGGGAVIIASAATDIFAVGQNSGIGVVNIGPYSFSTAISSTADLFLRRNTAANLAFGAADAASPVAQTLSVQNVVAGTSNTAGVNWTRDASRGTGTGVSGSHIWRVAPAGSTGTSQNALVTALTLNSSGGLLMGIAGGVFSVPSGTNQRAGNLTLIGGTLTVGNTTVTANTIVMLTRKTSGGTIGTAITYTLSAGTSFTVNSDNILDTSTFSYFLIEVP